MTTRHALATAGLVLAGAVMSSGCWLLVGVENREAVPDESDVGLPADACLGLFASSVPAACATCLEASCCDVLRDCADSARCRECIAGDPTGLPCDEDDEIGALRACVEGPCGVPCAPEPTPFQGLPPPSCDALPEPSAIGPCIQQHDLHDRVRCNPVTNVPCETSADEACSIDPTFGIWDCHATGHHQPACERCGLIDGGCAPGHGCIGGLCYRYCCDDGECGSGGCASVPSDGMGAIAVCVAPATEPAPPP